MNFDVIGGHFYATKGRRVALSDVVTGSQTGRQSDKEISSFYISVPSGAQLAYLGALIVEQAQQRGYGRELPDE